MSQIPFVDELGDVIEEAIRRDAARSLTADVSGQERTREPRWRRWAARHGRWRLGIVLAALAIGGAAAVAQTLQNSTALVTGGIACYSGTGTAASAYYNVEANGRSPQAACAQVFRVDGPAGLAAPGVKLVACADPNGYVAVFKDSGSSRQCQAEGMSPLQAGPYAQAQSGVDQLVAALTALGANRRCIAPGRLVDEVQHVLDRLGWSGWHAALQSQPAGSGSCGLFEGTGASFSDPTASLDAAHDSVWIAVGPIPSLLSITGPLDLRLMRASGSRCYTPAGARALVEAALSSAHAQVRFALTQEPSGTQVAYAQAAYDRGCTIVGSITAAPEGRIVDVWLNSKSAAREPLGAGPSAGQFQAPGVQTAAG